MAMGTRCRAIIQAVKLRMGAHENAVVMSINQVGHCAAEHAQV